MEEKRLRDEIRYLSNDQESDRDNYRFVTSNFLGFGVLIISIIIGLSAITFQLQSEDESLSQLKYTFLLIMILILLHLGNKRKEEFKNSRKEYNNYLRRRGELIEEKYAKIYGLKKGNFKEKLDKEFNEIT